MQTILYHAKLYVARGAFGVKIPHWTESLKVCMKNLKNL